jgi:hypothetical protein
MIDFSIDFRLIFINVYFSYFIKFIIFDSKSYFIINLAK